MKTMKYSMFQDKNEIPSRTALILPKSICKNV